MKRAGRWKNLFGDRRKRAVRVRVGNRLESLTDTQAHRFDELVRRQEQSGRPVGDNPFEQQRYSLADAAFRLMISESEILDLAASGSVTLFADVSGLSGRWRRTIAENDAVHSPEFTLRSGHLAISTAACRELRTRGHVTVTTFVFPTLPEPTATGLDAEVLAILATWCDSETRFATREPRSVTTDSVVLLAPLPLRARQ